MLAKVIGHLLFREHVTLGIDEGAGNQWESVYRNIGDGE